MTAMTTKPTHKRKLISSEDQFDLAEARASYIGMPLWQRLALWFVLGMILIGIVGDMIF
jgi:hypothetical protein